MGELTLNNKVEIVKRQAESIVKEFNRQWPIGTAVWKIDASGERYQSATSSVAWITPAGRYSPDYFSPVVQLKDIPGIHDLTTIVCISGVS